MHDNWRVMTHGDGRWRQNAIDEIGSGIWRLRGIHASALAISLPSPKEVRQTRITFAVIVTLAFLEVAGEWLPSGPD